MNDNQKKAIDTCMSELASALQSSLFEVYLSSKEFLNDNECDVVHASGATNSHRIMKIFSLLKWKEGSWEVVIQFLNHHKCLQLASKLLAEAKMEPQVQLISAVGEQRGYAAAAGYNAATFQGSNLSSNQVRPKQQSVLSMKEKVKAIDAQSQELCAALKSSMPKLMSFLLTRKIIDDDDQHEIAKNNPGQQIVMTLDIIKVRDQGWETLIEFLSSSGFRWLKDDLMSEVQNIRSGINQ